MTTWNTITIENAPADLTLDTLPDALRESGEIWEDRDESDQRPAVPAHTDRWGRDVAAYPGDPDGVIEISGHSKWHADAAETALRELSRRGARITWSETWDDEDGGRRTTVYENGEPVVADCRHDEDVPDNLDDLIQAVRDAHADASEAAQARRDAAAAALCDALRPPQGAGR